MEKMEYDKNNVFAKIIRGEIPSTKIYEDDKILCFKDVNPVASVHVLIIPKGEYINFADFTTKAGDDEINHFWKTIPEIAKKLGVSDYRLVTNCGKNAGQIVFHFHVHLIANAENNAELEKKIMKAK